MDTSTTTTQYFSDIRQPTKETDLTYESIDKSDIHRKVLSVCRPLIKKHGVHSLTTMIAAGFHYTGNEDKVRCNACGLEVSNWTLDMKPFTIHAQRSSTCSFVRSLLTTGRATVASTISFTVSTSTLNNDERSYKRLKIEDTQDNYQTHKLVEVESLKQVRKRTFSHWPHRVSPSSNQMIEAGFFNCNVGDRVICLYCNLICQQWTPHTDDPCEIHKTLSPKCSYVIAMLIRPQASSIPIVNETSIRDDSGSSANNNSVLSEQLVSTTACNVAYREIPKRYASFNTWPNENLPSVDDLVRAGFFYTGSKTIVTCFYCNGSLQNWGVNDNPTMEHARWFPHCAYAKQLCGDDQHRKIQESNQRRKEREEKNELNNQSTASVGGSYRGRLHIPDESTLSRLVSARLDLPISQSMLNGKFKLSIVKRCFEDQLRLKCDDFVSDVDLLIACTILQKQIEYIDGKKEKIIIPSVAMNKIRETEQILLDSSNNTDIEMSTSSSSSSTTTSESNAEKKSNIKSDSVSNRDQNGKNSSSPSNPCALCLTEEKCLASVPCGHVATCVPCGHSLRLCPICRSEIKAFVRVYL